MPRLLLTSTRMIIAMTGQTYKDKTTQRKTQGRTVEGKRTYQFQNSKPIGSGGSSRRWEYFYGA
ncbi:hypothetical protein LR48_Vigan05g028100 [Vigna angularis]|uniref:Uncharacterized protein n=1 Tax=Phaseolus angularis TaxID=3914 RepID=A0A0L9UJE1_PHAAN|nr:hypothetical protein LR48_Vigan05g028100 [Vigna angularis]